MVSIPSSLYYLPRRTHIFFTAAIVYIIIKFTQWMDRLLKRSDEQSTAAWIRTNTTAATIILRTSSARRGLWIKCCQYVASRSDALPPEYAAVLSKSLDDCPPTPASSVLRLVNSELASSPAGHTFATENGTPPTVNDFFHDFHPASPIASASIAQVHVATERRTGRKVVLKVQHPHIRPMLLQDLLDLRTLLTWIAGAEPKFDMRPVLDAWIDMVPLETDFLNERSNLDEVRLALANAPAELSTTAYVPEPLPQYSTEKVLVMEFVEGAKLSDTESITSSSIDRKQLVEEIAKSFGCQLFICEVFSGDPHPGNFLVNRISEGGHPVLLDFGICVKLSAPLRVAFAQLVLGTLNNDSYTLLKSLGGIGIKLNRADPVVSLDIFKYLFRTTTPRDESRKEQENFRKNMEKRENEVDRNMKDASIGTLPKQQESLTPQQRGKEPEKRESRSPIDSFPGDLVFFFRSLGMLRGLASSLNVRTNYLDTLRPYAEYTLKKTLSPERRLQNVLNSPFSKVSANRTVHVLDALLTGLYEKDMMIGMQVAAYHNDELVLNVSAGRMGRYDDRPVTPDAVFNSFSTTKGLTAILFASIQDEYGVEYSDLVGKYWPEYAKNGKESTKIQHILSHSSGLANSLPEELPMPRLRDDWQGIIRHFEDAKPSHPPGEKSEYHAITFGWIVAGLIMKITGKSYQELLSNLTRKLGIENECYCGNMPQELLEDSNECRTAALSSYIYQDLQDGPLAKMMKAKKQKEQTNEENSSKDSADNQAIHASDKVGDLEGQRDRALRELNLPVTGNARPPVYMADPNFFNHPVIRAGFIPSANGHFTARALAKLYSVMTNDGIVEGIRVLAPGRAKKMQQNFFDISFRGKRAWCAGLTLFDTADKDGKIESEAAVGHGGIGGSFAFAVPQHNFSLAVTLNKLNVVSISSALVIATVCKTLGVPMPEWYHRFASRALNKYREETLDGINGEGQLLQRMMDEDGEVDVMQLMVG